MRYFQADLVYTLTGLPVYQGVVVTEDDGTILDVLSPERIPGGKTVEVLKGILVPGFVNTHCHLELSGMKGRIKEHTRMDGFIRQFLKERQALSPDEAAEGIQQGEEEMYRNGIVAVGDISNTADTISQKARGRLYYHTFVEVFDLNPSRSREVFQSAEKLYHAFRESIGPAEGDVSLAPHAPYTVSPDLHQLISAFARHGNSRLTIHNQESEGEMDLFQSGSGKLAAMFQGMGIDLSWLDPKGISSLEYSLRHYSSSNPFLLVHNTYSIEKDIRGAAGYLKTSGKDPQVYWVSCPNANLYIENRLPDYSIFIKEHAKLTIGTDSLASNHSLSILDELKTIQSHNPGIGLDTLLTWACKHGAEALGIEAVYGTIEKGKRPGLVLISGTRDGRLQNETKSTRVI